MELCHGQWAQPVRLSSTRRYTPQEIRGMCKRVLGPFWLRVEGKLIQVHGEECMRLACEVSAAYHDWVAYNVPEDDGFCEDMAERERRVQARMEEPSSSDDDARAVCSH
jgi:hypothetical protein